MMKKILMTAVFTLALAGCSGGLTFGTPPSATPPGAAPQQQDQQQKVSPESRIVFAANAVGAAAALGETLLKNDKISVGNAKSYKGILDTAAVHIRKAADDLKKCRDATMSKPETRPDPCAPTVWDDINLAIAIAADVQKVLGAK